MKKCTPTNLVWHFIVVRRWSQSLTFGDFRNKPIFEIGTFRRGCRRAPIAFKDSAFIWVTKSSFGRASSIYVIFSRPLVHLFDHGFRAPLFHRQKEAGKSWRYLLEGSVVLVVNKNRLFVVDHQPIALNILSRQQATFFVLREKTPTRRFKPWQHQAARSTVWEKQYCYLYKNTLCRRGKRKRAEQGLRPSLIG